MKKSELIISVSSLSRRPSDAWNTFVIYSASKKRSALWKTIVDSTMRHARRRARRGLCWVEGCIIQRCSDPPPEIRGCFAIHDFSRLPDSTANIAPEPQIVQCTKLFYPAFVRYASWELRDISVDALKNSGVSAAHSVMIIALLVVSFGIPDDVCIICLLLRTGTVRESRV